MAIESANGNSLAFDYATTVVGRSTLVHADCFEWLSRVPENSLHAVVTDPPYGVKEYEFDQLEKRANVPTGASGGFRRPSTGIRVRHCRDLRRWTRESATDCGDFLSGDKATSVL